MRSEIPSEMPSGIGIGGGSSCGCGTAGQSADGESARLVRSRSWLALGSLAGSCGLACAAVTVSALAWPFAALAAGFGAYWIVRSRGCGVGTASDAAAGRGLDAADRRARKQRGAQFLALGVVLAAVACCDSAFLWPPAGLALWFGASFWVAGARGYPGCPELGAIPSWLLGREVGTTCPPLDADSAGTSHLTGDPN